MDKFQIVTIVFICSLTAGILIGGCSTLTSLLTSDDTKEAIQEDISTTIKTMTIYEKSGVIGALIILIGAGAEATRRLIKNKKGKNGKTKPRGVDRGYKGERP